MFLSLNGDQLFLLLSLFPIAIAHSTFHLLLTHMIITHTAPYNDGNMSSTHSDIYKQITLYDVMAVACNCNMAIVWHDVLCCYPLSSKFTPVRMPRLALAPNVDVDVDVIG